MEVMLLPTSIKIYHIVHIDRLRSIIDDGNLWSDARMIGRTGAGTTIGMCNIKARRMLLPVGCHPSENVGNFVPFHFCSRSVMLYLIHCANHPELAYRGGQGPIVHLECDLEAVLAWAEKYKRPWAISLSNAAASYSQFRCDRAGFAEINWEAVTSRDFRMPEVKEAKQAEFLVHDSFPWNLVERIGVLTNVIALQVIGISQASAHRPKVEIQPSWYY
jgi:hypothetical protein